MLNMPGKIIKIISNLYTVKTQNGLYECRARGKFRNLFIVPLVGDECIIDEKNKYILKILPRKNSLSRPMIANVDLALIVTSVKKPNLSLSLLDKMISIISLKNIVPILIFTKIDLLNKEEIKELEKIKAYYVKIGYSVFDNQNLKKLYPLLKNKIIVVTGQTGAGKSTLLNQMDTTLHLKTDEISESLGRGKHTTRHVELFQIKDFYIADTPGFSSLDFLETTKEEIRNSFKEFSNYTCRFKNCMHDKEQDCAVKEALENGEILESRYQNYLSFIKNK